MRNFEGAVRRAAMDVLKDVIEPSCKGMDDKSRVYVAGACVASVLARLAHEDPKMTFGEAMVLCGLVTACQSRRDLEEADQVRTDLGLFPKD